MAGPTATDQTGRGLDTRLGRDQPYDDVVPSVRIGDGWIGRIARRVPLRSVLAGSAGTAAMSGAYAIERRLRSKRGPLDYDDSLVPGQIVASIMHLPAVTPREDRDLGLLLRWGYGSAFGIWHGVLRRRFCEPLASVLFGATLMSATLSLFPLLGRTPPPWRWPPDVMATCLGSHLVYVLTLASVDDALGTCR